MSRHRSPQGRRAHLGPPLFALPATAGVGAARSLPPLSLGLPVRFVATVVAGGALAAAGQQALVTALPAATDGANVLRLGVEELLGAPPATHADVTAAPRVAVAPVVPAAAPVVADAAGLVKAAGLHQAATEAARADVEAVAPAAAPVSAAVPAAAARATAESRAVPRTAATHSAASRTTQPTTTAPRTTAPRTTAPRTTAPKAAGVTAAAAGGVQVVVGTVTSGFGSRWGTFHEGLDIAAPIGTPIHAPVAGTVISSGPASGFGLWVRLQHADGTITVYGHINRSFVTVGQQVRAGQVIAEVGNRGESTGPHLHIGVMINGVYVDPRPWLDQRGIRY